jgi:hypothetical protein
MTDTSRKDKSEPETESTPGPPGVLVTLPFVGATTVEDVAFYTALGVVTILELVSLPTAALVGSAHVLHQRVRNLVLHSKERGAIFEGALEVTEEVF